MKRPWRELGRSLATAVLLLGVRSPAFAQAAPPDPASLVPSVREFLEIARSATARYQQRGAAIRDGYRLLGPDFPSMGEHWIHPGLMIGGRLDPARPQVLGYATVDGEPRLIGVAYALPLAPGQVPPDFPPGTDLWHDHSGRIDEESVLLNHTPSGEGRPSGHRIVMLHAWVWLENPDGVFADHNWSLPYVRLGLAPPERAHTSAAKALSLSAGGDAYYRTLFRALGSPSAPDEAWIDAALSSARQRVDRWIASERRAESNAPGRESGLAVIWDELGSEILRGLSPPVAEALRPIWATEHVH